MPQQAMNTVENNFTGGLKTEFTGLNFPENACTDTDNCVFSLIGEVSRRPGIDTELNAAVGVLNEAQAALSSYVWTNVNGDGNTKLLVRQMGSTIYFFDISGATIANPTSSRLVGSVSLTQFFTKTDYAQVECQFASGNGYLFVFSPSIEPLFCSYILGSFTLTRINVQVRDFIGVATGMPTQFRSTGLSPELNYDLFNQGWSSNPGWTASSTSTVTAGTGSKVFTVASGLSISNGQTAIASYNYSDSGLPGLGGIVLSGTVTSYSGTTLTLNITSSSSGRSTDSGNKWTITTVNSGLLNTWASAEGNYPSHADVWWRFKNNSGVFDPATTQPNVTLGTGPAEKGFYILNAFDQNRSAVSGIPSITPITTTARPRTGTWFQGRVWFAGVDATQASVGNAFQYTWSENIYFSQVVENVDQFGKCYQNNDPTSETFFDLLPTDGGVLTIQGAGSIYKLFPVQNGLLVFAANGIWFITGSQGIGFSANDYTIVPIADTQCLSGSSFVNVLGYPVFWNHEGIHKVEPSDKGGLVVNNLCWGTILSFYSDIPLISKIYVKGDYDPVSFTIKWLFRSTEEDTTGGVGNRYSYDRVLNYNTSNKAFYPYTINTPTVAIRDIKYIRYPGGTNKPESTFKYMVTFGGSLVSLAEERDTTNWVDFFSGFGSGGIGYDSYFVTGYKLHGKGLRKWQPVYLYMFFNSDVPTAYKIQGIWDYATEGNSGRFSSVQMITNALSRFGIKYRRHKIRGSGLVLQLKVESVDGMPFSIIGWTSAETANAGT